MAGFHLSDPWSDFTRPEEQEYLRSIEAKQGVGLIGAELHCVFQSYLPAGTTQECCAYLSPLYRHFRTPGEDWAHEIWDDILWIWLHRARTELEQLNQYERIIEEMRRIVHDTLIPAEWKPEEGPEDIYHRTTMLISWMSCPWGKDEMPTILDTLSSGGFTQQLLLLRLFLTNKDDLFFEFTPGVTECGERSEAAYGEYRERFNDYFRESTALYDALEHIETHAIALPANDASGSTIMLYETADKCRMHLWS
ncbi:MAG: hypothetical protein IKY92_02060 [Akkermansia sp.]|nr:hypothetical protein [Akkermansia sp.]